MRQEQQPNQDCDCAFVDLASLERSALQSRNTKNATPGDTRFVTRRLKFVFVQDVSPCVCSLCGQLVVQGTAVRFVDPA